MHRTQLLLEPWQYDALRTRAERAGISLSELVRRVVTDYLTPDEAPASPLLAMEGLADGPVLARDHDAALYATKAPRKRRATRR